MIHPAVAAAAPVAVIPPRPAARGTEAAPPPADGLALRHLRHHTNNMLQRLLADLAGSELQHAEDGRRLLDALQARIMAGAAVSNALFAVTQEPAPLERRLRWLCDGLVRLHAGVGQAPGVEVRVSADAPAPRAHPSAARDPAEVVVRVARELVENALRHGMHARAGGRVWVRVTGGAGRCVLSVADDGWGPGPSPDGPGLALVRDLVAPLDGTLALDRHGGWTVARVVLATGPARHGGGGPS